jgi:sec-independent protein translocase protein TatC
MQNETAENEMSFLDHLEVLRWHIVRAVVVIIIFSAAAFVNKEIIFDGIILAPKKENFITYQALCNLSHKIYSVFPNYFDKETICIGKGMPALQNITMAGQFTSHILVSLILSFPYVFWEIWKFIKPGLKQNEKQYARGIVFFTSLLFLSGVLFGYYVIAPLSVNFLINYKVSEEVLNIPTLTTYISTVTTVVLATGAVFELPIVVYFLTKIGLLTPAFMRKYRRHAIIIALILAAIITPPDVFSQLLVTIPLLFLYEISIYISAFILRKKTENEQQ